MMSHEHIVRKRRRGGCSGGSGLVGGVTAGEWDETSKVGLDPRVARAGERGPLLNRTGSIHMYRVCGLMCKLYLNALLASGQRPMEICMSIASSPPPPLLHDMTALLTWCDPKC